MPRSPHDRDRSHWIVYGALTRSVLDTAIVLDAVRGPMPGDASPLPEPARPFADSARSDPGALRIAVSSAFPAGVQGRLAPEVRGALDRTVELLRELGHTVVERDVDFRPRDVSGDPRPAVPGDPRLRRRGRPAGAAGAPQPRARATRAG